MMRSPGIGLHVRIWCNRRVASSRPLHGVVGVVRVLARGPGPRNHGIEVDGTLHVVPCGNLMPTAIEPPTRKAEPPMLFML